VGVLAVADRHLDAGADGSHTYKIELDNAFGLVNGSQVRIAGVTAGQVTDDLARRSLEQELVMAEERLRLARIRRGGG